MDNSIPYDTAKRTLDVVAAGAALVVLSPLFAVVALGVRMRLGSPVVFKQLRPGRGEKLFNLYKFRSMLEPDSARNLVTNEQRLTSFGRALRAASLDELPSLVNVLKGDMSLVGPRPLRADYLSRYSFRQGRRHEVRPGITGLAQVSGRNALSWDARLELDVKYVDNRSLPLDLRILFQTILKVVNREGVTGDGLAAMSAFMGNDEDPTLVEHPLSDAWLEERVAWLSDPNVSGGVSLSFTPTVAGMRDWWPRAQADTTRRDFVYTTPENHPVAMCGLSGVTTPDASLYIYVNPDELGRGYGKRSMRKLMKRAQSYGIQRLHLEVRAENTRAIALYTGLGFITEDPRSPLSAGKQAMVLDLTERVQSKPRDESEEHAI